MKLYAEHVLRDFFHSLGLSNFITFGKSMLELEEIKHNKNFSDMRIFLNILNCEYDNTFKQSFISARGIPGKSVGQRVIGIIDFEVKILLIGTNKNLVYKTEELIAKRTNRYFSVGGFKKSKIVILKTRYEDEEEQVSPLINIVDIEMTLTLPAFYTENVETIEGRNLEIIFT